MKINGIVLTESEIDSLNKFIRRESPLVEFARSIRNEGQPAVDAEPEPFDLLKGIDIDNLPSDVVEKLKAANSEFCNIAKSEKEAKELAKKNEQTARDQQARADRNYEKLRQHNLVDVNGNPSSTNTNDPEAQILQQLTDEFIKEGIDPKIAATHAKLQIKAQKVLEPNLFKKISQGLNPALETIGDMHAGRLLAEAQLPKNDPDGFFEIPEVANKVQESLDLLVKNGATITKETITNLVDMAHGSYLRTTPEDKRVKPKKEEGMRFSTSGTRSGVKGNPQNRSAILQNQGAPRAADAETQRAIDATVAQLKMGMNFKKGAK